MTVINNLPEQSEKNIKLANLYRLQDLLNLMQKNLNLILAGDEGQKIIINHGNLFQLATEYYNEATLWTAIAESNMNILKDKNGFINPNISQVKNIVIPPKPTIQSNGILSV